MSEPPVKKRRPKLFAPRAERTRNERATYRPLALEIAWIAFEWNRLQENLGKIFARVIRPDAPRLALAVWHSTYNDRAQRDMLRAAVEHAYRDKEPVPGMKDAIIKILREAGKLAERRNNAIHAPFVFIYSGVYDLGVHPNTESENPRAKNLTGKDVLLEFEWYHAQLTELAHYADELEGHLWDQKQWPWPGKLQLPHLGQSRTRKAPRRKRPSK